MKFSFHVDCTLNIGHILFSMFFILLCMSHFMLILDSKNRQVTQHKFKSRMVRIIPFHCAFTFMSVLKYLISTVQLLVAGRGSFFFFTQLMNVLLKRGRH